MDERNALGSNRKSIENLADSTTRSLIRKKRKEYALDRQSLEDWASRGFTSGGEVDANVEYSEGEVEAG